jgi:prolyl-tRNA synthetase
MAIHQQRIPEASRRILPWMIALVALCLSRQSYAFQAPKRLLRNSIATQWQQSHGIKVSPRTAVRLLSTTADLTDEQKVELEAKIKAKGDEIRALKEDGAEKAAVAPLVQELLALKTQLDPSMAKPKKKQQQQPKKHQQKQGKKQGKAKAQVEDESDFITARSVDYSKWYNDLIRVAGLAETSPVRGCMVIKPWGMSLWDKIRTTLDATIQEHGAENAYFPLLIPKSFLSKEAEHVDGFAKECAVVTHHRLTAGEDGLIVDPEAELEDPLIIRPTSETMIWFMFRKWINSHR